jgi:hypothetical protein
LSTFLVRYLVGLMFVCALSQLPKQVWFDRQREATIRQSVNGLYTVWTIATRTKLVVKKAEITIRSTNAYLATVTELAFDGFEEEILPLVTNVRIFSGFACDCTG